MRPAVARAITGRLCAAADLPGWPCQDPVTIACPRGCGFITAARDHLMWGPWRMQLHLISDRCNAAISSLVTTTRRR
jgi:hypothetical protein